eukprot:NODE_443_length_7346_cov_1.066648.p4 type:complete len:246 gc:universal NODE_443_length_7346_cov_1.066648:1390-653(-)
MTIDFILRRNNRRKMLLLTILTVQGFYSFIPGYNTLYMILFSYPFGIWTLFFTTNYGRQFNFLSPNQYANPTYKVNETLKIELIAREVRFYDHGEASFWIECPDVKYRKCVVPETPVKQLFGYYFKLRYGYINWKATRNVTITKEMKGNCKIDFIITCDFHGIECANRTEQVPFIVDNPNVISEKDQVKNSAQQINVGSKLKFENNAVKNSTQQNKVSDHLKSKVLNQNEQVKNTTQSVDTDRSK